jgi:transposase InsO family protein
MNNVELAAHRLDRPTRPRLPKQAPNSGTRSSRQDRTAVSSPDNGAPYRSTIHAIACRTLGIRHLRTRPYRPQTNGKAERFIRTLLDGWAYGAIYNTSSERTAALDGWLWYYNHQRRHSALGHKPPIARLDERTNLLGTYN